MLNVNEKMDYTEEVERNDNFREEVQLQFEAYNSNYSVNYFGLGRTAQEWQ